MEALLAITRWLVTIVAAVGIVILFLLLALPLLVVGVLVDYMLLRRDRARQSARRPLNRIESRPS